MFTKNHSQELWTLDIMPDVKFVLKISKHRPSHGKKIEIREERFIYDSPLYLYESETPVGALCTVLNKGLR